MLVRCMYASRAATGLGAAEADAILAQSRRNNPPRGITGILCVCQAENLFIQVLEGGRDAIGDLLAVLMRDPRHHGLRILTFEEIAERRFGHWSMGQVDIARVNTALLLKYSEKATLDPFSMPGQATLALLAELVASASIGGRG
jgi:hypothetical protein